MKAYRVSGRFLMGNAWQDFTKEVVGADESAVREVVFSRLGSKHRVRRNNIMISEVTEIPKNEVTDPITKYTLAQSIKAEKKKGE